MHAVAQDKKDKNGTLDLITLSDNALGFLDVGRVYATAELDQLRKGLTPRLFAAEGHHVDLALSGERRKNPGCRRSMSKVYAWARSLIWPSNSEFE